jgi:hypothetical protein
MRQCAATGCIPGASKNRGGFQGRERGSVAVIVPRRSLSRLSSRLSPVFGQLSGTLTALSLTTIT